MESRGIMATGVDRKPVSLFEIVSVSPGGKSRSTSVAGEPGAYLVTCAEMGETEVTRSSSALSLDAVLEDFPDLTSVGSGLTSITWSGDMALEYVLEAIRYVDPEHSSSAQEAMISLSKSGNISSLDSAMMTQLAVQDEVLKSWAAVDNAEIVPTWLTINGTRAFQVRWDGGHATGLMDLAVERPVITKRLLEWGFLRESYGPCSFDGHAELGYCGPGLWISDIRGDSDPGVTVMPAKHPSEAAAAIARWLHSTGRGPAFILSVCGTPGLDGETRAELDDNDYIEGEWVVSHLDEELEAHVVEHLVKLDSQTETAMTALRDATSERGKIVYEWLTLLALGDKQGVSWDEIYAAMYGQVGPPDPEELLWARSHRAEVKAREEAAAAAWAAIVADAASRGWAPPVSVPSEVLACVREAESRTFDIDLLDGDIEIHERQTDDGAIGDARSVLGIHDSAGVTVAWRAYETKAAEDPGNELALFEAYTLIQFLDDRRRRLVALRKRRDEVRSLLETARAAGWPDQWPIFYFSAWKKIGGSLASARAWAAAGWSPREVLTEGQLKCSWNAEIRGRVRTRKVPQRPAPA